MNREDLEYWRATVRAGVAAQDEVILHMHAQHERIKHLEETVATISKLLELLPAELWEMGNGSS